MSRLRTNIITNRMANGAPTVSNGLVISGITTTSEVNVGQGITFSTVGNATFSGIVTATSFIGDGSSLTGITQTTINNNANNRVITGSGTANTLEAESSLTWDGNDLSLSGTAPAINFIDTDADDYKIHNVQGLLKVTDTTASADRFVINDNGTGYFLSNFQIGSTTSSPGATLHIKTSYPSLKVDSGGHASDAYVRIISGNAQNSRVDFGDSDDDDIGMIDYDHANNSMRFRTNTTERVIIDSTGKLTMSSGTVELQSHMIRVGNRTTAQINAGVSTSTGALVLDTTDNNLKYYANATWKSVKQQGNDGSSQNFAARSAKDLLDLGITTNGVYWLNMHGAYTQANSKRHYCLQDSSYDGGGWTMLWCMNHGNNFASGTNYSYALNVGNPTTVSDFTAGNWGYDRRNTFTPQANDQFLIRRSDNNDWRRFVVTTWSPTANSVSNGWTTASDTTGTNRGHPYYALGQMYDTSGNAVSGMINFNGCAIGGNCATGGGDSDLSLIHI